MRRLDITGSGRVTKGLVDAAPHEAKDAEQRKIILAHWRLAGNPKASAARHLIEDSPQSAVEKTTTTQLPECTEGRVRCSFRLETLTTHDDNSAVSWAETVPRT